MIITGGLNVYSSEVEQAIAQVGGVKQVAVAGVFDRNWGEAVVAFVVPENDDVSAELISASLRTVLTGYKRPKRIVMVPSLPVTAVGKVDKKQLRGTLT